MEGKRRSRSFHESDDDSSCDMKFITPEFNGATSSLSIDQLKLDDDINNNDNNDTKQDKYSTSNDINDGNDDSDNDEKYTRGRSRSRSVHEMDSNLSNNDNDKIITPSPPIPVVNKKESTTEKNDTNNKMERSGPLQHREVLALKKGLEEATNHRNREQIREEEDERRVAEQEKNRRKSNFLQAPLIGADPQMRRVKILLLGDSGVGKSSLILRWTADTFSPTLVGTVGVNFKSKKVVINSEAMQVQVWDTAGQEQFHKITTSYYKGANGIMVVYDVSDKKSLDNVEYWVKNIKAHATESVQVVIVGNKTDLRTEENKDNCFDENVGKEFSNKYGVPYFETSAKDSTNVDDAFLTLVRTILSATEAQTPTKSPSVTPARSSILERASQKSSIFKRLSKSGEKMNPFARQEENNDTSRDKEKCIIS